MTAAIFTPSELARKDWTVHDAITAAQTVLTFQKVKGGVNLTSLRNRPRTDKINLQELNDIQDQLVAESRFWDKVLSPI